jgi:hypothetical protein
VAAARPPRPFRIPAPSLANNLLGDPAESDVVVLLPAGYETSGKRYPTSYFLTDTAHPAVEAADFFGSSVQSSAPGAAEMIGVVVCGRNALLGSFYVNSSVDGELGGRDRRGPGGRHRPKVPDHPRRRLSRHLRPWDGRLRRPGIASLLRQTPSMQDPRP